MNKGFGEYNKKTLGNKKTNIGVTVNVDEVSKILKDYKKLKKYMNSSIFQIKTIDNTETVISSLINDVEETID
jgi:hypothetical protein